MLRTQKVLILVDKEPISNKTNRNLKCAQTLPLATLKKMQTIWLDTLKAWTFACKTRESATQIKGWKIASCGLGTDAKLILCRTASQFNTNRDSVVIGHIVLNRWQVAPFRILWMHYCNMVLSRRPRVNVVLRWCFFQTRWVPKVLQCLPQTQCFQDSWSISYPEDLRLCRLLRWGDMGLISRCKLRVLESTNC